MGRPALSEREPYDTETLTDIALRLFVERGYDATSMADVARAAGITKSSVYHHVQSKEELLERGVNRALDALFAALDEAEAKEGAVLDRLRHLVERAIETEIKYLPDVTVLVRLRGNTDLERRALERRREFDTRMARIVRRAQADRSLRHDIDPVLITRLLMGMEISLTEWYQPDGMLGWRDIADAILAVAFDGLKGKGAP